MEQKKDNNKQLARFEDISKSVLDKINIYEQEGSIKLPSNYNPGNALKSAWLILQETKDRADRPVLDVCTKASIARALMDMVMQGLSAVKKQCYFIAYGDKLTLQKSYFGSLALAKNVTKGKLEDPVANIIYEGDEFAYEIDQTTGRKMLTHHRQNMENISPEKIKGAYCIYNIGGIRDMEIMTIAQIKKAWDQGSMKGKSGAHINFTDQMCKKTVINRACKTIINSSNDAWLDDGEDINENTTPDTEAKEVKKNIIANETTETIDIEEVAYVDMDEKTQGEQVEPQDKTQNIPY